MIDTAERRDNTGKQKLCRVTEKKKESGTLQELWEEFETAISTKGCVHLLHHGHHQQTIRELKAACAKSNEAIVQMDFAENCKYGSEVQSIHFGSSRDQGTIHDGVIYVNDQTESFATISNSMKHDAVGVWAYVKPVLQWMLERHPNVRGIHFVTDGPTSQYRCRQNFLMSTLLRDEFPVFTNITWNFSEAGHGKSAADGIGAVLKRTADAVVALGECS